MECKKCAEKDDVIERLRLALNDCDVEITEQAARIAELEAKSEGWKKAYNDYYFMLKEKESKQ